MLAHFSYVESFRPSFPVVESETEGLSDWPHVVFVLHFEADPGPDILDRLAQLLRFWYEDGFFGAYGGQGFHWMSDLLVEDQAIAWEVDFGDAEPDAYYDLLHRLEVYAASAKPRAKLLHVGRPYSE